MEERRWKLCARCCLERSCRILRVTYTCSPKQVQMCVSRTRAGSRQFTSWCRRCRNHYHSMGHSTRGYPQKSVNVHSCHRCASVARCQAKYLQHERLDAARRWYAGGYRLYGHGAALCGTPWSHLPKDRSYGSHVVKAVTLINWILRSKYRRTRIRIARIPTQSQ